MNGEQAARVARARIANALRTSEDLPRTLGNVTLHDEQWEAACRAAVIVRQQGGVLVANDVGSGKTFLALAAARAFGDLAIVAPAALRPTWERALAQAEMRATIIGVESLSRAPSPSSIPMASGVVIIDESHHLRTPTTRRYAAAASLCARSRVILLSATPLQNRLADIAAQLALFLGERAWTLDAAELATFVVRGTPSSVQRGVPDVSGPHRVTLSHEDDWLDTLLSLPPPIPPSDGGEAGALLAYTLVRRWASSNAALVATLERRLATALAIEHALESGRWPTRRQLSAWSVGESAMQLAFPELIASPSDAGVHATMQDVVRQHADAVRALLRCVRDAPDADAARAEALRDIRRAHPGEIVIAFSEYAETVVAIGKRLALDGGVAWLTSRCGHTAAGILSRREILAQLVPRAVVADAERIALLVTTDVLSEGLDLQRASVVVHLDLPWNPARLEQRVGRVRRIGSAHARVSVYTIAPPARSDRLTRIEQRLREKLRLAARAVGVAGRILPPLFSVDDPRAPSAAEARAELLGLVAAWSGQEQTLARPLSRALHPTVATVRAPFQGFLAAIDDGTDTLLVADVGRGVSIDDRDLLRVVIAASGAALEVSSDQHAEALRLLDAWWTSRRASAALDLRERTSGSARTRALARLASITARTPRHERPRVTSQVELARSIVNATLSAGSERVLGTIVAATLPDEAWLRAIAAFAETHGSGARSGTPSPSSASAPLIALILLTPSSSSPPSPNGS